MNKRYTTTTPLYRRVGISIINWLYNVGSKKKVADSQSCFRVLSPRFYQQLDIEEDGFGASTEMLIKARAGGFKIKEVPIECIYHKDFRENSTLNPIRHGISVAWATIKWRLRCRT